MEDKYLQVKKENILTRIIKYIKNIFHSSPENTKLDKEVENTYDTRKDFFDSIRNNPDQDTDIGKLQKKYENNEITVAEMSDEDLAELKVLYIDQIKELKMLIADKQSQLKILKNK